MIYDIQQTKSQPDERATLLWLCSCNKLLLVAVVVRVVVAEEASRASQRYQCHCSHCLMLVAFVIASGDAIGPSMMNGCCSA